MPRHRRVATAAVDATGKGGDGGGEGNGKGRKREEWPDVERRQDVQRDRLRYSGICVNGSSRVVRFT